MAGPGAHPFERQHAGAQATVVHAGEDREELFPGRKVKYPEVRPLAHPSVHNDQRAQAAQGHALPRSFGDDEPPANVRHSFRRERDESSPDYTRGRQDERRGIRYDQAGSSYSARRPSPPLRTSSKDYPVLDHYTHPSRTVSPLSKRLPIKDISRPLIPRNPSWTRQDHTPFATTATIPASVHPNGMQGISSERSDSADLHSHRPEPHVFIAAADLPTKPSTIKHLKRFFRKFGIQAVFMDSAGFYITFLDTSAGVQQLVRCAKSTVNAVLFSQYRLHPKPYYKCQRVTDLHQLSATPAAARPRSSSPGISILGRAAGPVTSTVQHGYEDVANEVAPSITLRPLSASPEIQAETLPTDHGKVSYDLQSVIAEVGFNSVPLPSAETLPKNAGQPRSDDNASMISGTTSSSRSRLTKCHVCRGLGGSMSRCGTCSSHYHKHCRPKGSKPETAQLHWQCERCVRKGKDPSVRVLSSESNKTNEVERRLPEPQTAQQEIPDAIVDLDTVDMRDVTADTGGSLELVRVHVPAEKDNETAEQSRENLKRHAAAMQAEDMTAYDDSNEPNPKKRARTDTPGHIPQDVTEQSLAPMDIDEPLLPPASHHLDFPPGTVETATTDANQPALAPAPVSNVEQPARDDSGELELELSKEAQLLVEKSFAAIPACSSNVASTKKFKFTRVKLSEVQSKASHAAPDNYASGLTQTSQQDKIVADNASDHACKASPAEAEADLLGLWKDDPSDPGALESTEAISGTASLLQTREDTSSAASPADSVIQAVAVKSTGPAKARRSRLTAMRCSGCGKKIPFHPSGNCSSCRDKAAEESLRSDVPTAQGEHEQSPACMETAAEQVAEPEVVHISGAITEQDERGQSIPADTGAERGRSKAQQRTTSGLDAITPAVAPSDFAHDHVTQSVNEPTGVFESGEISAEHSNTPSREAARSKSPSADVERIDSPEDVEDGLTNGNTLKPRKFGQRQTQRTKAADEHDLGDSLRRPKNTYMRLVGMALCAAEEHTATPKWVTNWVANNIPNYHLSEGDWAKHMEAVMCLNATGRSGKIMLTSAEAQIVEGGRPKTRKMYSLLPGLEDQLEHWDEVLQQPRSPITSRKQDITDLATTAVNGRGVPQQHRAVEKLPPLKLRANASSHVPKANAMDIRDRDTADAAFSESHSSNSDTDHRTRIRPRIAISATVAVNHELDDSSEEDVPLMSRLGHHSPSEQLPSAANAPAKRVNRSITPAPSATLQEHEHVAPAVAAADRQDPEAPFLHEEEELALLQMIDNDNKNRIHSSLSLFADRPQYDPKSDDKRRAKMAEIAQRPRRKEVFGKPAGHSVLGFTPLFPQWSRPSSALASGSEAGPLSKRTANTGKPKSRLREPRPDGTQIEEFATLEDFLNVPDDLVPAIVDKQLVYRHRSGMSRTMYKTGI
ncbi:hypothetical protein CKM354_000751300 [Cercospora kikuchii]|uniref:Histone lysine methyltransferase SET associated domain-containing protein n=1 Tax=Cercospora kikuchii TaxID=84275 RepID=A0A9P3FED5_9PEZI|nr:uncharacterized protein CKM354_000751300 [Cercospora kikuchii]GIZ44311.1 hypothetical protein CKM354_000751300 [Cercospora kikuchii]